MVKFNLNLKFKLNSKFKEVSFPYRHSWSDQSNLLWDQRGQSFYFFISNWKNMTFGFLTSHSFMASTVDGSNVEMYAGYLDSFNITYNQ